MRISDWSSYVCSSDVLTAIFTVGLDDDWVKAEHVRATAERFGLSGADVSESIQALKEHGIDADEIALLRDSLIACFELNPPMSPRGPKHQPLVPLDRMSVVWGKSVSVRVDLVGRRFHHVQLTTRAPRECTVTNYTLQ